MATFVNREKEIAYLNHWLHQDPNAILFMYGPKSGGKSTLIDKVIQPLAKNKKLPPIHKAFKVP